MGPGVAEGVIRGGGVGLEQFLQDGDNLYVLHDGHEVLLLPKKPGAFAAP